MSSTAETVATGQGNLTFDIGETDRTLLVGVEMGF